MNNSSADRTVAIRSLKPRQAGEEPIVAGVVETYRDVFGRLPYNEPAATAAAFGERLQKETARRVETAARRRRRRPARFHLRVNDPARPVVARHRNVGPAPEVADRWFTNAFAIVEFAVRTAVQNRSVGKRLTPPS